MYGIRMLAGLCLALLLSGCALWDARGQLQLMGQVCTLQGHLVVENDIAGPFVVTVFREPETAGLVPEPVDHAVTAGGRWFFGLVPGRYRVLAFADPEGEREHAAGDVVFPLQEHEVLDCPPGTRHTRLEIRVEGEAVSEHAIALPARIERGDPAVAFGGGAVTAFGEIVSLEDPRFDLAVARDSQWRVRDFMLAGHAGVYFLEPFDPVRTPVLFVHGMNGSPRVFEELIATLDSERYQPWLYYYPSGLPLAAVAVHLAQTLEELELRHGVEHLPVVAHSMGGLVAGGFLREREHRRSPARIPHLIAVSTPWGGHAAAQRGVDHSPVVIPVWRDMAPGSRYLQRLFESDAMAATELHLLFSYRSPGGIASAGTVDGVATLSTLLHLPAQQAASSVFGVAATHTGILTDPLALERVRELLEREE